MRLFGYTRELVGRARGTALLAYLSPPFHMLDSDKGGSHYSNWIMAVAFADALNRLGYSVDVIDYTDHFFEPTVPYDVFVGMTGNFARLLPMLPPNCVKIYLATRSEAAWEIEAIRQRDQALHRRRGRAIGAGAQIDLLESPQYRVADALVLVGNATTKSTFDLGSGQRLFASTTSLVFPARAKRPAKTSCKHESTFCSCRVAAWCRKD